MRCETCDYPLWNLKTRQCPECGTLFTPGGYEFVPNSVRFCCPNCSQAYYGTGEKGHLEPARFDCVSCSRHLTMNDMVLEPAAGLEEEQTTVDVNPWLARKRIGWFKGWFSTIGRALVAPGRLMRGTPEPSPAGDAWRFCLGTFAAVIVLALVPLIMLFLIPLVMATAAAGGGGAGAGGPGALLLTMTVAGALFFGFVVFLIYVVLWGLVTHGLIRISGQGHGPIRRTYQAICYSSGAYVVSAVPCFGKYVAGIWWVVSAVIMVKVAHGLSGLRATFAVVTFPLALIISLVAVYAIAITAVVTGAGAIGAGPSSTKETRLVLVAVIGYGGQGPSHAVELVTTGGLEAWDLVGFNTATGADAVPVGTLDLFDFAMLEPQDRQVYVQEAIDGLPEGTVAHRLGDFVFTYHGIDPTTADPRLWLVVMTPDPDAMVSPPRTIYVGQADGTVRWFATPLLKGELAEQNRLRALDGLPPLPDPSLLRHGQPGVASDDQ